MAIFGQNYLFEISLEKIFGDPMPTPPPPLQQNWSRTPMAASYSVCSYMIQDGLLGCSSKRLAEKGKRTPPPPHTHTYTHTLMWVGRFASSTVKMRTKNTFIMTIYSRLISANCVGFVFFVTSYKKEEAYCCFYFPP